MARTRAVEAVRLARDLGLELEEGKGLRARVKEPVGQVALACGGADEAMHALERSLRILAEQDPYEAARTRVHLSVFLVSSGDAEQGKKTLEEARETFEGLDAARDLSAVDEILADGDFTP
jgi:hypothetical protein